MRKTADERIASLQLEVETLKEEITTLKHGSAYSLPVNGVIVSAHGSSKLPRRTATE
jgi:hypothetical protein